MHKEFFSFSEEPAKKEENKNYKRSAAGINSRTNKNIFKSMTVPLIELQTKRCRYEQLKEQEYFQKHDDAFYRNMVKISV